MWEQKIAAQQDFLAAQQQLREAEIELRNAEQRLLADVERRHAPLPLALDLGCRGERLERVGVDPAEQMLHDRRGPRRAVHDGRVGGEVLAVLLLQPLPRAQMWIVWKRCNLSQNWQRPLMA